MRQSSKGRMGAVCLWCVVCVVWACGVWEVQAGGRNYALLVGIAEYKKINSLKWPEHDVDRMVKALKGYGFSAGDMRILKSAQATKAAMMREMERLRTLAKPGDRVVFYYSGHGSRVKDVHDPANGLELDEADGEDETLAPYGATTEPQTHIVDDWIARWAGGFRTRRVVLIFDNCHSGGITKAGIRRVEGRPRYWENPDLAGKRPQLSEAASRRIRVRKRKVDLLKRSEQYVALLASRAEELAWESKRANGGVFTTLLVQQMAKYQGDRRATFEKVFKEIEQGIWKEPFRVYARIQHPQMVGMASSPLFFRKEPLVTPEQSARVCDNGSPQLCVKMQVNAKPGESGRMELTAGELMYVHLQASRPCTVEIWTQSTEGKTVQLFPNRLHASFSLRAGQRYRFPTDPPRYRLRAKAPAGPVRVWAVVYRKEAQRAQRDLVETRGSIEFEEMALKVKPLRVGVLFWVVE